MGGDLLSVFLLALAAMFNPTLLAAVTLMLMLEEPKRLMVGYLLGAYLTSITLGLLIVFELEDSAFVSSSENTVAPATDFVLGGLLLAVALALSGSRGARRRERRAEKAAARGPKKESLPQRLLGRGSPRVAFAVGVLLSFPGASYLAGLSHIDRLDAGTVGTVLLVLAFCVVQLALLEVPLLGYVLSPERTRERVARLREWLDHNGGQAIAYVAGGLGALLILRAVITLL